MEAKNTLAVTAARMFIVWMEPDGWDEATIVSEKAKSPSGGNADPNSSGQSVSNGGGGDGGSTENGLAGKGVARQAETGSTLSTEEAVGFFLRRNPDFLAGFLDENPDMLLKIRPPEAPKSDGVVDLRHVMLERLRDEVTRLKEQQRGIISASRANLTIQNRVHSAALHLLDADSFQRLIDTIANDLLAMLDLDMAALIIERSGNDSEPHVDAPGVRVVPPDFIDNRLEGQEILLQSEIGGDEHLYGDSGKQVRSQALIRLTVSSQTPPCLLALGSSEPDMFQDGMRTDLTAFLARIMERCIRLWLDLPE
jgi:uncharacterized protein YigA (DUF484 family)